MKLKKLISNLDKFEIYGDLTKEVSMITTNTKNVIEKSMFIAIKGTNIDSHALIDEAISNGAIVVVGQIKPKSQWKNVTYIKVENSREALSYIAASWYGNPSKKLKVIGVTGTDGKTTTTNLIWWILKNSGRKVGLISTISAKIGGRDFDTGLHVTNPDPISLQGFLSQMVKKGCTHAVLEVTSHGIDQKRIAGINFDCAAITNITREHLDYHKTFEEYRSVKSELFRNINFGIINKDDLSYGYIRSKAKARKLFDYSLHKNADYIAKDILFTKSGTVFNLETKNGTIPLKVSLHGEYNISNTLCAISIARIYNVSWEIIKSSLRTFPTPEGRLQKIENKKDITIYIDFAHTPNSLQQVLTLLKKTHEGRLICVFGCASKRDLDKRNTMPKISTDICDISVFTAEDPRDEDINDILKEMSISASKNGAKEGNLKSINTLDTDKHMYFSIPERGQAISDSINKIAKNGDTVIICGKGHEKSMAYKGIEYPWSDKDAVELALLGKVKKILWQKK